MTRTPVTKYEVIETFLTKIKIEPSTQSVYRSWLNHYFKLLEIKNPDTYFDNGRDYSADIEKVATAIKEYPPRSQQSIISCVKRFMQKKNIQIDENKWEEWTLKKPYAITMDKRFTPEELRTVLEHADLKMKALAMFLGCTGCRLREALLMTSEWVDMKNRMVTIPAEISKTKRERYTFFSEECKRVLDEWLKQREKFLTESVNKSVWKREQLVKKGINIKYTTVKIGKKKIKKLDVSEIIKNEDRVFPMEKDNAIKSWNLLLERCGLPFNKKDMNKKLKAKRYQYHLHTLRKMWFSRLMSTDANPNHVNFLGGHETYLAGVYNQFLEQPELLKRTYDKFSFCLNIYDVEPSDINEMRESNTLKDTKIKNLENELEGLKYRVFIMEKLEKMNEKIDKKITPAHDRSH